MPSLDAGPLEDHDVADPAGGSRLLRLAATCPGCGSRPAVRITETMAKITEGCAPDRRLATYRCQNRHCRRIFALTAAAHQQAHT